jgi:carboxylesterase type B
MKPRFWPTPGSHLPDTARPDNPAIPEWPAYTQAERATMVFDDECRKTRDPDRDARVLWTRLVKADGPPVRSG